MTSNSQKNVSFPLQLEDAEYASQAAIKAKKTMELELADMQQQIDELFKNKQEVI